MPRREFPPRVRVDQLRQRMLYDPTSGRFTRLISTSSNAMAGSIAGSISTEGYIVIRIDGTSYRAHSLAWLYMTGDWPAALVDHINGVRDDNRWANLRQATNQQNCANGKRRRNNKSGFKGVSWGAKERRWKAQINENGRRVLIGLFTTAEEAHAAYSTRAVAVYGEFARFK